MRCADVTQGDSGNYTCEVDGPQNTILGQTTHFVYVRGESCTRHVIMYQPLAVVRQLILYSVMSVCVIVTYRQIFQKLTGLKLSFKSYYYYYLKLKVVIIIIVIIIIVIIIITTISKWLVKEKVHSAQIC